MVTCRSLISICSLHHSPVRSISEYTLGNVPSQEHISIYSGQGPLPGAYHNILWARSPVKSISEYTLGTSVLWLPGLPGGSLASVLAEGKEPHQCSTSWSLWEARPKRPSGKFDYPRDLPELFFQTTHLDFSLFLPDLCPKPSCILKWNAGQRWMVNHSCCSSSLFLVL